MDTFTREELEKTYPTLSKARICANQANYSMASDLYSEVLTELIAHFPQDTPELCRVYIDYAFSLVQNCVQFFTNEYLNLATHQASFSDKRKNTEDDLEIAWSVLEIARVVLAKDKLASMRIRYLLGEILLLNNNFNDAICEYTESMALSEIKGSKYCECLLKIASCHEFMKDYEEANVSLKKIVEVYENMKEEGSADELIQTLLKDIHERIEFNGTKYLKTI